MRKQLASLKNRLSATGVDHRRIARGILVVSTFTLVGKFAGAAKDAAIAYRFGVGEIVDVYSLALIYSMWVPLVFGGVLGVIYVPLIHKLHIDDRATFKNQLIGVTFITAGVVTLVLLYLLPLILKSSFSDQLGIPLTAIACGFAPIAGLGILGALFNIILLADERHVNTLFDSIPSLTLLIVVLAWPSTTDIDPLVWGTLVGFGMQTTGLYYLLRKSGNDLKPTVSFASNGWKALRDSLGIVVLGQLIMSCIDPITYNIAERLGVGNVSSLNYTSKLLFLFLTLGGVAISRAILPVFSNTERGHRQRVRLAMQWTLIAGFAGILTTAAVWLFAHDIVRLVYERGAFNSQDTESIAYAVRLGALQFPFYFSGIVLAQLFISLGNYKIILISACTALVVKVVFSLLLSPSMAFSGIILATVPMYLANNLLFSIVLYRLYKAQVPIDINPNN